MKPNQFKVPDLVEENLHGDVFGTMKTVYKLISDLGKFKKDEKTSSTMTFYNRDGNLTHENFASSDEDFNNFDPEKKGVKFIKRIYDSANRTLISENYMSGGLFSKEITKYNPEGEKITNFIYYKDDDEIREIFEYSDLFTKYKDCSVNECDTKYTGLDDNSNKVSLNYDNEDRLVEASELTQKGNLVAKGISYNFCHNQSSDKFSLKCTFDSKPSKITINTYSYDPRTNQLTNITSQVRDFDNSTNSVERKSYSYEYKYDSKGNWIEKIEKKEVTKFGETYFEPVSLTERKIRYYSDPDTKPVK